MKNYDRDKITLNHRYKHSTCNVLANVITMASTSRDARLWPTLTCPAYVTASGPVKLIHYVTGTTPVIKTITICFGNKEQLNTKLINKYY